MVSSVLQHLTRSPRVWHTQTKSTRETCGDNGSPTKAFTSQWPASSVNSSLGSNSMVLHSTKSDIGNVLSINQGPKTSKHMPAVSLADPCDRRLENRLPTVFGQIIFDDTGLDTYTIGHYVHPPQETLLDSKPEKHQDNSLSKILRLGPPISEKGNVRHLSRRRYIRRRRCRMRALARHVEAQLHSDPDRRHNHFGKVRGDSDCENARWGGGGSCGAVPAPHYGCWDRDAIC